MSYSVSGANDSAPVMYYTNTNYNSSTTLAKPSEITEQLSAQMMDNQSNYLVGINKVKISSLDGVVLSYFPQNTLEVGLTCANKADPTITKTEFAMCLMPDTPEFLQVYTEYITTFSGYNISVINRQTETVKYSLTGTFVPTFVSYIANLNLIILTNGYKIYSLNPGDMTYTLLDDTTFIGNSQGGIFNWSYDSSTTSLGVLNQYLFVSTINTVVYRYDCSNMANFIATTCIDSGNLGWITCLRYSAFQDTLSVVFFSTTAISATTASTCLIWNYASELSNAPYNSYTSIINFANLDIVDDILYVESSNQLVVSAQNLVQTGSSVGGLYFPALYGLTSTQQLLRVGGDSFLQSYSALQPTAAPANQAPRVPNVAYVASTNTMYCFAFQPAEVPGTNNYQLQEYPDTNSLTFVFSSNANVLNQSPFIIENLSGFPIQGVFLSAGIVDDEDYLICGYPSDATNIISVWIYQISVGGEWLHLVDLLIPQSPVSYEQINSEGEWTQGNGEGIDSCPYFTINSDGNIIITYNVQPQEEAGEGLYFQALLNPLTTSSGIIQTGLAPYVPHQIIYDGATVSAQNPNLMWDNYMVNPADTTQLFKLILDIDSYTLVASFFLDLSTFENQPGQFNANFLGILLDADYSTNQLHSYSPGITTTNLQFSNAGFIPQNKYGGQQRMIGYNNTNEQYNLTTNSPPIISFYSITGTTPVAGTQYTLPTYRGISNDYSFLTELNILPKSQLAVYDLQTYITIINNAFSVAYELILGGAFTTNIKTAPVLSIDWSSGILTLTYDPLMFEGLNRIYINNALLNYLQFQSSVSAVYPLFNKLYIPPASTSITQSKLSFFKFNQIDKLIVVSSMSIIGDQTGSNKQTITFTDLDLNLNDPIFLNMSGCFIYDAILMRNYTLQSNQGMRIINYGITVRYLDKEEVPYLIPPQQNVSIKFQFTRIY